MSPTSKRSLGPAQRVACRVVGCALLCLAVVAALSGRGRLHEADSAAAHAAAQRPAPTAAELRWFKGNLHTHSLWSDGNDFPEMIVDWYVRHGYHFLGLSDHNILSEGEKWIPADLPAKRGHTEAVARYRKRFGDDWVQTRDRNGVSEIRLRTLAEFRPKFEQPGRFLMLQAEEISDRFGRLPIHINANNLQERILPQGGDSVRSTIARNLLAIERQAKRTGQPILGHVNHPNFGYAITAEDMAAVLEERFFEVYNGHPGVRHLGDADHVSVERMWDIANTIRIAEMQAPPLYGLATDDSHNYLGNRGSSPGRGWVMVRAAKLTPAAVVTAMQAGRFYASSGVTLDEVAFDPATRQLQLRIRGEEGVNYTTQFIGTPTGYDRTSTPVVDRNGKEIPATRRYSADVGKVFASVEGTQPTYTLTGNELFVRAVVTSSRPHPNPSFQNQHEQAWTQPVGWEQHVTSQSPQ